MTLATDMVDDQGDSERGNGTKKGEHGKRKEHQPEESFSPPKNLVVRELLSLTRNGREVFENGEGRGEKRMGISGHFKKRVNPALMEESRSKAKPKRGPRGQGGSRPGI